MTPPAAAGFILAGGKSSRMGRDKALVEFHGQPLIAHALRILSDAGLPAFIAGGHPDLAAFAPLVPDLNPGLGPLGGICSALASIQSQQADFISAVFISIDQPLLPPPLIQSLLHHAQISASPVALASFAGFTQTFPAVLDIALLPALQAELHAGRSGCFSAFQSVAAAIDCPIQILNVESLAQTDQISNPAGLPPQSWFLNINSSDDLRLATSASAPSPRKP